MDKEPIIHDGVEPVMRPTGDRNITQPLEDMGIMSRSEGLLQAVIVDSRAQVEDPYLPDLG